MQKAVVSSCDVGNTKESVLDAVSRAMRLASWEKHIKSSRSKQKKIFIKINLLSHQVVPGHCTSPYILEGVLKELSENGNFKIYVGDANVATIEQVEAAAQNWGVIDLCKKYHAAFVNLSKQPVVEKPFKGEIFKTMYFPKILVDADYIITLPVPKTHNVSTMTCSLKNQWGCIPTFRQQYHDVVHQAIAEINKALHPAFVVCDATVCSEGEGPRTSTPKVCNHVFASADLVAMDSFIADFIGIDKRKVGHIQWAEKLKVGISDYFLTGDLKGIVDRKGKTISQKFKKAVQKNHPIVFLEMKLRKVPVVNYLLFKTFIFKIPAYLASRYNSVYWYKKEGKQVAQDMLEKHPLYTHEFKILIERQKDV